MKSTPNPADEKKVQSRYGWEIADDVQRFVNNSADMEFVPKSYAQRLEERISELELELEYRAGKIAEREGKVSELEVERDELDKKLFDTATKLANSFLEKRSLERDNATLTAELAEANKRLKDLEDGMTISYIAGAERAKDDLMEQNATLTARVKELEEIIDQKESMVKNRGTAIVLGTEQIDRLTAELAEAKARVTELETFMDNWHKKEAVEISMKLEKENAALTARVKQLEIDISEGSGYCEELDLKNTRLAVENDRLKQLVAKAEMFIAKGFPVNWDEWHAAKDECEIK